jgi:two-component system alkaline phosphatase synthesis response regulator PhoP
MAKILIAEDEKDIRELITLTLQFSGFDVVSARDGQEAVDIATSANHVFDLILMDVRMPRKTGYQACRELRENETTQHIPLIFLSAKGQETEVQQGIEAGADQYILKPFAPDALIKTVKDVLSKKNHGSQGV